MPDHNLDRRRPPAGIDDLLQSLPRDRHGRLYSFVDRALSEYRDERGRLYGADRGGPISKNCLGESPGWRTAVPPISLGEPDRDSPPRHPIPLFRAPTIALEADDLRFLEPSIVDELRARKPDLKFDRLAVLSGRKHPGELVFIAMEDGKQISVRLPLEDQVHSGRLRQVVMPTAQVIAQEVKNSIWKERQSIDASRFDLFGSITQACLERAGAEQVTIEWVGSGSFDVSIRLQSKLTYDFIALSSGISFRLTKSGDTIKMTNIQGVTLDHPAIPDTKITDFGTEGDELVFDYGGVRPGLGKVIRAIVPAEMVTSQLESTYSSLSWIYSAVAENAVARKFGSTRGIFPTKDETELHYFGPRDARQGRNIPFFGLRD